MLALITGGLHRLGGVIAARLAREGYDLALHAHRAGEPDPHLAAAIAQNGCRWAAFAADLADPSETESLVDRVTRHFGRAPDILVNSASIISEGAWDDLARDELIRHLDVNLIAPLLLSRCFARALPADAEGVVINLLDQRVRNPPIDQAAYTASKLALAAVTRVMARAFAPRVRINAIAPGMTLPGDDFSHQQWQRLSVAMPLGRTSMPENVADAVAYLVKARATTGQILFVDGGANLESHAHDFVHLMRE